MKNYEQPAIELIKFSIMDVLEGDSNFDISTGLGDDIDPNSSNPDNDLGI